MVEVRDEISTEDVDADLVIDPTKGQVAGHIAAYVGVYTGNVQFYRVSGNSLRALGRKSPTSASSTRSSGPVTTRSVLASTMPTCRAIPSTHRL